MKPRTKGDSYAIHRPDAGLINSDALMSNYITRFDYPRNLIATHNGFRNAVMSGIIPRIGIGKALMLFVYVCACEGRDQVGPVDYVNNCIMNRQAARTLIMRTKYAGYIVNVRRGVYTLTDSGRELYATLIDSITTELTGPFRWRP